MPVMAKNRERKPAGRRVPDFFVQSKIMQLCKHGHCWQGDEREDNKGIIAG